MKTKGPMPDMFFDVEALARLQGRIGGVIVVLPGDAPALRHPNGAEFCNVTGRDGNYDLWVRGDLKRSDMTLAEVEAWVQVRK